MGSMPAHWNGFKDIPVVHREDDSDGRRESAPEPEAPERAESSEPVAEQQASTGPSPVGPERTGHRHCPSHTRAPKPLVPPTRGTNTTAQRRRSNQRGPDSDAARRRRGHAGEQIHHHQSVIAPVRCEADQTTQGGIVLLLHQPGKGSIQGRSTPAHPSASVASATSGSIHRH